MSAHDIASVVREGERVAQDVVEEYLAEIDARESELHSFNHVLAVEARDAAAAVDAAVARGDDPGPLAGGPGALKDNMGTRGVATTWVAESPEGGAPPVPAPGGR